MRPPAVRRAVAGDLPHLVRLEEIGFPDPWPEDALARELGSPTALVLAAAPGWDAPAVAYALFHTVADEAELLRLAVLPEERRRGYARALLAAGRHQLAGHGCHTCFLEVRAENAAAIALYEATGFHRLGRRPGYYGQGHDALLYAGSLRPAVRPGMRSGRRRDPRAGG